ncbi:Trypsin-like serine proteases typically periplasmic [Rubrobacter radiotolerans]|uniref:Trypsin-like peptidase domain-containing protein n=1 Tax=Rubrobacter radiotolerans TaxID=42256 RepID=A0A023X6A6_RUBRA|nr:trypsin-like peptidase domain-containing protein [Rubrobacter radiotolerans]AHY47530.1 Trypsin-like serine proteases typically periplasmic [Rubrobacter radiotolerans]MDX5894933.1 trypsin-like peptidase domain-containing protein [Rubrobacter radiotolerans]SMC07099.1 serine protease Do [Rubrobacter radiotolerans DSM 5868]
MNASRVTAQTAKARRRRKKRLLALGLAAGLLTLAGCATENQQEIPEPAPEPDNVATQTPEAAPDVPENEPVARIASQVEPSVVQVNVSGTTVTPFGEQEAEGLGSGVIYTSDGYIITNNHVVEGASEVTVAFADGTTETGEVVGNDPRTDLAVIDVDRNDLPAANFNEDSVTTGQLAVAIGSPSGFESTVTAGVVSGVNRELSPQLVGGNVQDPSLVDLIQTDAAISPGNSGGALVNRSGEVIGINVAYLPQTQSGAPVEGIGFAIPASTATSVADQLIADGEVTTAYIGVVPVDITAQDAEQFGLDGVEDGGAGVAEVASGSPADDAGLQTEDVIVAIDDREVQGSGDLYAALRDYRPGETVTLTVVRDGSEQTFDITLGEAPNNG